MAGPVLRVSIARCEPVRFADLVAMMTEAEAALAPGIRKLPGLRAYFAGADEATSSLTNVSIWDSLEAARQMETFQPMLDLGRRFADAGAVFERPIMNYATLWQVSPPSEQAE